MKGAAMKRIGLWAIGIGLMGCVGISTVELGYADEKEPAKTCSLATVKGRYLFATSGTLFPPAAGVTQPTLFARAGYRIFYGDGTGTIIATTSANGVITAADAQSDLSYTVNEHCTGTLTVLSVGATAEIFVAPDGDEMVVIQTGKGQSDAHSSRRVGPE
jgi:hypothetical protein